MSSTKIEAIITFCVLALITFIYVIFKMFEYFEQPEGVLVDEDLDTGDVLVLPFDSFYGDLVRVFGGTLWTHAGMVIRKPDGLYIAEMLTYKDEDSEDEDGEPKRYKNFNIHPIDRWKRLSLERVVVGVSKLKKRPTEAQCKAIDVMLHVFCEDSKANLDVGQWMQTMTSFKYNQSKDSDPPYRVFCTEAIARVLQFAGVLNTKLSPRCYRPNDFSNQPEYEDLKVMWMRGQSRRIKMGNLIEDI